LKEFAMKRLLIAITIAAMHFGVHASDLGISAEDAYQKIQKADQNILLVDVRDPVEIMFVGFSDAVHINVPFMLADRSQWNAERNLFKMVQNPDFVAGIKAELEKRGLSADAEIITMCRSGSERGEPSATLLRKQGFPNARYVINGFQGGAIKEGPQAGFRLQNGWQNIGLPWSAKLNPEKIYRTDNR